VLRVSRRCWRKFTSSFWLIPSSRASSCAFIADNKYAAGGEFET
jgi:hypothetical protein